MGISADREAQLRELMLAALAGDAAAYRRLLAELGDDLRRYFRRRLDGALAASLDDLVQDTLLAMHTRRHTYDSAQPLGAWVHGIARYKLIDLYRRSKVRRTVPLEDDAAVFARDESGDVTAKMDVDTLLGGIPARSAALIRHVKLEGASVAEAAARSGMSESAVKVAIHRGLKALAARFGGRVADE